MLLHQTMNCLAALLIRHLGDRTGVYHTYIRLLSLAHRTHACLPRKTLPIVEVSEKFSLHPQRIVNRCLILKYTLVSIMSLNHIFTTKVHIIIIFFLLLHNSSKKTCNDTRKLYQSYTSIVSARIGTLPVTPIMEKNESYTYGEVARKLPNYTFCSSIAACAAAIR